MENGRRGTLDSDVFEDETTLVPPVGPKEKASDGASNKRFLREVSKAFLATRKRSDALKETEEIPSREREREREGGREFLNFFEKLFQTTILVFIFCAKI